MITITNFRMLLRLSILPKDLIFVISSSNNKISQSHKIMIVIAYSKIKTYVNYLKKINYKELSMHNLAIFLFLSMHNLLIRVCTTIPFQALFKTLIAAYRISEFIFGKMHYKLQDMGNTLH